MEIRYSTSSKRHHVSAKRSAYVVQNASVIASIETSDLAVSRAERTLYLGTDRRGIWLEVIAVEGRRGDLFVIHAMLMRPRFRSLTDPIH